MSGDYERQVAELVYPAQLSAPIKRLLAKRLWEIDRDWNVKTNQIPTMMPESVLEIASLPPDQKAVVERYIETEKAYNQARSAFHELFIYRRDGDTQVARKTTPEEDRAWKEQRDLQFKAAHRERDARVENLQVIARELAEKQMLAEKQIAAVRAKIPQDLVEKLDKV